MKPYIIATTASFSLLCIIKIAGTWITVDNWINVFDISEEIMKGILSLCLIALIIKYTFRKRTKRVNS